MLKTTTDKDNKQYSQGLNGLLIVCFFSFSAFVSVFFLPDGLTKTAQFYVVVIRGVQDYNNTKSLRLVM